MFTLDQIFDQMFPMLSGISFDLGTMLSGMIFLWLIAEGASLLWKIMDSRTNRDSEDDGFEEWLEAQERKIYSHDPRDYIKGPDGRSIYKGNICRKTGVEIFRERD